jgi:hypothetical protein
VGRGRGEKTAVMTSWLASLRLRRRTVDTKHSSSRQCAVARSRAGALLTYSGLGDPSLWWSIAEMRLNGLERAPLVASLHSHPVTNVIP